MWWWQSVAFGGALVFAGAVPVDHGTCCACADDIAALAADAPIIAKTALRFQSCPGIVASLRFCFSVWTIAANDVLSRPNAQGAAAGRCLEHDIAPKATRA